MKAFITFLGLALGLMPAVVNDELGTTNYGRLMIPHSSSDPSSGDHLTWEVGRTIFVGKPISYENLTLFPITAHRSLGEISCVPLDEAMRKHWFTVSEIGNVNTLVV